MSNLKNKGPYLELPLVGILLCTYNGEKFLSAQLDSIQSQTHSNWVVYVSDDGSDDDTLKLLEAYQKRWSSARLKIRSGPQKGFCANFLSLACDPLIVCDNYAFCDQDDVWLPTKLEVALKNITDSRIDDLPYVYCGRTAYVTETLRDCGASPLFIFPRDFRNALVQSIAGGNTMVINRAAKFLLETVGMVTVPSHDWWIYQLVTGVGGVVFYDPTPQILYRQHHGALIGGNRSFGAKLDRLWLLLKGRFRCWNSQNIEALSSASNLLTASNLETLRLFKALRGAKLKDRIRLMEVCGLYRQTRRGTFSLFCAAFFNKL